MQKAPYLKLGFVFTIIALSVVFFTSCKKDRFLTQGGDLAFSVDTLSFDTVFTTVGSATRSFKVFNRSDRPIKINRIYLSGGDDSFFRLNVDGEATKDITNVEVAGNDSIYVFVALTVDPTSGLVPFVIDEKVEFELNEKRYDVPLQAYGQDAHFIDGEFLQTATWINDKPYVIVNSAAVDTGATLTIQEGCRVYMHANSSLFVAGTLRVFGTVSDSVIFQGDRLDRDYFGYEDYPGEWGGIHFLHTSLGNEINYAVIKNGGDNQSMVRLDSVDGPRSGPVLRMTKSIVYNSLGYGFLAFNSWAVLDNCLVHSCGLQNLALIEGGRYEFHHNTFVTYGSLGINHANQPVAAILNYRDVSLTAFESRDLNVKFNNNIIYGPLESEVVFANKGTAAYNVTMQSNLLKYKGSIPQGIAEANTKLNQDPLFVDRAGFDFHILASSPAKNAGIIEQGLGGFSQIDLDGVPRGNPPSMGCYE